MTLLDLAKKRCSIRKFAATEVEQEKIDYIMEAVRMAPSAVNLQPWLFLIVKSEEGLKNIQSCYKREWINTAPMHIVAFANHEESWKRRADNKDHADIDVSIAVEHLCLAAAEQGLGTCWVCNFDVARFNELFHVPEHLEPVAIVPIGYPEDENLFAETPKKRKEMEAIVRYETL